MLIPKRGIAMTNPSRNVNAKHEMISRTEKRSREKGVSELRRGDFGEYTEFGYFCSKNTTI